MVHNSVTHLILFIVIIVLSTMFVGMVTGNVQMFAQSVEEETDRNVAAISTEVSIINHPEAGATYDTDTQSITLYLKNIGDTTLEPSEVDVLVNGKLITTQSTSVIDGSHWQSGSVLEVILSLDEPLERESHRVSVEINSNHALVEFEHRQIFWLDPDSGEELENGAYTVDLNETEQLDLTMASEPIQSGVSVSYALDNSTVATFTDTGSDTNSGETNEEGEDSTTLDLHETGTVNITADTGWDTTYIEIIVEDTG